MKHFAIMVAAVAFAGAAVAQQPYPTRPVRIIVPWPPGQATDHVGRIVAQKLSEQLGQQVIADNRPGAGGIVGTEVAAKATPDGYTLLAASSGPITTNPLLQKVPYNPARDFAPVANVVLAPYLLTTNAKFPAANARELVALVKANPGKYNFASSGAGAMGHLVAELFNSRAGLQVTHVAYKGAVPALVDVISGQVAYTLETIAGVLPHVKTGRLKAYGISIARPSPLTPGIEPLATAADLPGFDAAAWIGIMVPAGTPKPIVERLTTAIDKAMKSPDTSEKLNAAGLEVDYRRSDDFARYLKEQQARLGDLIRKNNIRID